MHTRHSNIVAAAFAALFVLSIAILHGAAQAQQRVAASPAAEADGPLIIGLDAAVSGPAGPSGVAIQRGIELALDRINTDGGILGRQVQLVVRDNRGIPDRGIDNIYELAEMRNLVAVFGGIHSPVVSAELEAIHRTKTLFLDPWAASTPIVDNGYEPNFVFRVSVRDAYAGPFLIKAAMDRGFKRPGLLLWRTGWGRSNETAMTKAMDQLGVRSAGVQWFNTSERDLSDQIDALILGGADVIMLVANPADGLAAVEAMADRPEPHRIPIISHWGISGGDFYTMGRTAIEKVDLTFLQTFSFYAPPFPQKANALLERYCARYGPCNSKADVFSPVGTAHAYDLVFLLKAAIEKAGTSDMAAIRDAMEHLPRYDGLVRTYDPPFTPERHDGLDAGDFRLSKFGPDGAILPLSVIEAY